MSMKRISLFACASILLVAAAHAQTPIPSESLSWPSYTIKSEDRGLNPAKRTGRLPIRSFLSEERWKEKLGWE